MTNPLELPYGATDLFVLQRGNGPGGLWRHIAGVGAGAHSLGNQRPSGPLFTSVGGPWQLDGEEIVRMFGGYYAWSAVAAKLPDGRVVVIGSRDGRLALPERLGAADVAAELSAALRHVPVIGTVEPTRPQLTDSPHLDD